MIVRLQGANLRTVEKPLRYAQEASWREDNRQNFQRRTGPPRGRAGDGGEAER